MNKKQPGLLSLAVLVAALGFFVDVFDLLLFGVVRKPSLRELGLSEAEILTKGELLISIQMIGMMLGGIVWGILGDKKGRLKVLFGSILLYSLANISNGFVQTLPQYVIIRFIAGFGLAGELGAGITLTSEILPKEKEDWLPPSLLPPVCWVALPQPCFIKRSATGVCCILSGVAWALFY